jgi:CRISP-associated protein Cas1
VGDLFNQATTMSALRAGWEQLLADDRSDGALAAGVSRFADNADDELAALTQQLSSGDYRPQPLSAVALPKPNGELRQLSIPTVRDRVVERAVAGVLVGVIDPVLGPSAYGFRPGLGVTDAIQAIARLRDEGMTWALRADIEDCFPTIDVPRVQRLLGALIDDTALTDLIDLFLARPVAGPGGLRSARGLAQGSPLSPMLSNLALSYLDQRLREAGFPIIRYADDFTVATASHADAMEATRIASRALQEIHMTLGADKTGMFSFAEGFTFLGEEFGPRYPPVVDDHRVAEPERRSVFLGLQGSHAHVQQGRLVVESPDNDKLLDIPTGQVGRIVCFGAIGISAGLRSWALNAGIDIALLSRRGTYLGQLRPADDSRRMTRLRAQLRAFDDSNIWLPFGRAVVETKLRKQVVLLQHLNRRDTNEKVGHSAGYITQMITMLSDATDRDGLMGIEGTCARSYFEALSALVPPDLAFSGRSRRPPLNLVNSALSYGYALILAETVSAVVAAGLEPNAGLLHTDDDRRPSLALDLMEEFRPLVVDHIVINACRLGELRPEHARNDEERGGILLTKAGREILVARYERRLLQTTRGALPGFSGTFRRHLYRQAQRLAGWIEFREEAWTGLSWR